MNDYLHIPRMLERAIAIILLLGKRTWCRRTFNRRLLPLLFCEKLMQELILEEIAQTVWSKFELEEE